MAKSTSSSSLPLSKSLKKQALRSLLSFLPRQRPHRRNISCSECSLRFSYGFFRILYFLAGPKVWQTRLSLRTQFPSFSLPFIIRYQSTALLHIFYVQAVHKKFNMHLSQSSTSGMFFKKFKRNIVCEQIIRGVTAL